MAKNEGSSVVRNDRQHPWCQKRQAHEHSLQLQRPIFYFKPCVMEGPPAPPECGQRLLVTLIDQRAAANHARPYYSIPVSQDASAGYRDISYRTFSNAVNRCAHWIIRTLGRSSHFEPLAYLGAPDLRYQIFLIAAAKTGHVVRTFSPLDVEMLFANRPLDVLSFAQK